MHSATRRWNSPTPRSGKNLYFTMLSYGTQTPSDDDYLAADLFTGKVIVGHARCATGRPTCATWACRRLTCRWDSCPRTRRARRGSFEFRVDAHEFQRVLDAARRLDAAFSAAPADYLLDNFHFNNEVYRNGDLGLTLSDFKLELIRR
jgi:hypothetical protein